MTARQTLFAAGTVLLLAGLAPAFAQDITGVVTQASQWAITLVKALAVLFVIAGFLMFAAGRFHWAGGIVMLIGIAGAAKADVIAQAIFGA